MTEARLDDSTRRVPWARSVRAAIVLAGKIAVAVVLLWLLLRSGALDLGRLRVYLESPALFATAILIWFLGNVLFGTARWRVLLRLVGVELPIGRALWLQSIALFFNVAVPGSVGGDVIKAIYVTRTLSGGPRVRAAVLMIAFVERLLGLMGLIVMAAVAVVPSLPRLWATPAIQPLVVAVAVLFAGVVAGAACLPLFRSDRARRIEESLAARSSLPVRVAHTLLSTARVFARGPRALASALGISVLMHAVSLLLFVALTRAIGQPDASFASIALVYPLGILTLVLPIAPAGIGVGHLAFDRLYAQVGLTGGATVFNLYLVAQIGPSLFGAIPYVLSRKREGAPSTAEAIAPADWNAARDAARAERSEGAETPKP
jgi:uncharacterized protein (TIRG00374 family)